MGEKMQAGAALNALLDAYESGDRAGVLDAWHAASEAVDALRSERDTYREYWDARWALYTPGTAAKARTARVTEANRAVLAMLETAKLASQATR